MSEIKPKIVIIGGGITGLSAAWELQAQAGTSPDYTLLESTNHWGGKIITERVPAPHGKEFVMDGGPDTIITRKPEAWDLARELGIEDQVIDAGSETRNMYVLDGGKPAAIPLSPFAFISSSLMSTRGKLRILAEPFITAKNDDEDKSLASFVNRRLGNEALEKFIGPVLAGIYNTDPNTQSILTTSPIMREMEKDYGSLFKAVIGRRRAKRINGDNIRPPRFITFKGGAQELVDRCVEQLQGELILNARVSKINKKIDHYEVVLVDGRQYEADAVILATTANIAAELLGGIAQEAASKLGRIRHENIGTIALAYLDKELPSTLDINGLMIPRRENRAIDAVTFLTKKLPMRAPEGYTLLRVFFGGGSPKVATYDDDKLIHTVRKELNELLKIQAVPVELAIFRWLAGFPQADVGHLEKIQTIENLLPEGIYLAGSSYRGIGVPDCIRQGRVATRKAIKNLNGKVQNKKQKDRKEITT